MFEQQAKLLMENNNKAKSTRNEIRERFDNDVERFSNLNTGQKTVIDAHLCLELITDAVAKITPNAKQMLDIGCGAGNYTVKMLQKTPDMNCILVDLSMPMLQRALARVSTNTAGKVEIRQEDILDMDLPENEFCVVLAGAVLHHLRQDSDWEQVFEKIFRSLKPGGSFWVCDLVVHDLPEIEELFKNQYGAFLEKLGGVEFKQHVFDYVEKEDTPRSVYFQMDLMKKVGFKHVELLHKNSCFAAFGAVK